MTKRAGPIQNTIIISDLHAGCRLGLCPPTPILLDDGGTYSASPLQLSMWNMWEEFWSEWVPRVCRKEAYHVVINGDALDGVHHNSTTQISHNLGDQAKIAEAILKPVFEKCRSMGGTSYMIRGTEAHGGKSGVEEERLAKTLEAKPDRAGRHARYELWLRVGGPAGALCHILHHIGSTGSSAHEASAVNAELTAEYVEAARWGKSPPDWVIRSHRHRCIVVDIDTARGYGGSIVTPGWQAKTPFAFKVAGARLAEPQFGGILIRHGDEEHYYRRRVWSIPRQEEET